jgi:hypothetical protein
MDGEADRRPTPHPEVLDVRQRETHAARTRRLRRFLVNLVYNRGPALVDTDPLKQNRREMRAIRDLLASGDAGKVADQLDAMARLWDPDLPGLVQRRHDEATLYRSGFTALGLE